MENKYKKNFFFIVSMMMRGVRKIDIEREKDVEGE
jgi:hypothetical protein